MTTINDFWQLARDALGADTPESPPQAWAFGDSAELADELLALVLEGRKTATCDALWRFESDGEPVPTPGDLSIILDGSGEPRCVLEATEIRIMPMNEVDEQFAYDEGEGDRSRDWWHAVHEGYFSRTLSEIDREFDPAMPLVLERFKLLYP